MIKNISFLVVLWMSACFCDVKSTNGVINFDLEMDDQVEMILNNVGLGIGMTPSVNLHTMGNAIISNQLFVGGQNGMSNLNINGTIALNHQLLNSNTTLSSNTIVLVDSSSDNILLTLPYSGNVRGRVYTIKKISQENTVWLVGGGNLIDMTSPIELESSSLYHPSLKLISDGEQWWVLNYSGSLNELASANLVGRWQLEESQSQNLLSYNNDFSNAVWTKSNSSISSTAVSSPAGLSGNVSKYIENTGSGQYYMSQSVSGGNLRTYTNSVYVKQADADRHIYIEVGNCRAAVNLDTGVLYYGPSTFSTGWSNPSVSIEALSDGWYRVAISGDSDATVTTVTSKIHVSKTDGAAGGGIVYTGDGASGIYLTQAQLQVGGVATTLSSTELITSLNIVDSYSSEDGTLSDTYRDSESVEGILGKARYFNGTNGVGITLPSSSALQGVEDSSHTLTAWYYPTALPLNTTNDDVAHSIIVQEGNHRGLQYNNDSKFYLQDWGVGGNSIGFYSTNTFSLGQWYFVASTIDVTTKTSKLYVNNVLEGTLSWPAETHFSNDASWHIGTASFSFPRQPASGNIDEVRIYNRVLTEDELNALFLFSQTTP